jgi:hypothetical protein
MITTTAMVLLTLTATVSPVSPTVTPTYTAGELAAFNHGVNKGIMEQYCFTNCRSIQIEVEFLAEELRPKRTPNPDDPSDGIGDKMIAEELDKVSDKLWGSDRYGSKKSIRDRKARIKAKGCDCIKVLKEQKEAERNK